MRLKKILITAKLCFDREDNSVCYFLYSYFVDILKKNPSRMCVSVCLSVCMYVCMYVCIYLSIYLNIYLSIYLSIHPSIHPSIYISLSLSTWERDVALW